MSRNSKVQVVTSETGKQNLVYLFMASTPERSRRTYLYALDKIARHFGALNAYAFDWSKLRNEHTTLIRAWLLDTGKVASAHKNMAAVKGVLEKAYDLGMMEADDYLRAIKPCRVKLNEKPRAATGRMLKEWEIVALLETCKKGAPSRAARDAAIIQILYKAGLRRAEITTLTLADYAPDYSPEVGRLIVHGKGNKDRMVYIKNGTREALAAWLEIRGSEPGPLFYSILKSDEPYPRPMSLVSIWQTLKDRGELAGLAHFSTHDMRRSFCSDALDRGVDLATVADMMGHSNPSTTKGYDRRGEQRKMDAIL
jgi:integrase/recombinase XerD